MMPRDVLSGLFDELSATDLPVPPQEAVVARGRKRRLRARVAAVACALAVVAVAGSAAGFLEQAAGPQRPVSQGGNARSRLSATAPTRLTLSGTGPLLLSLLAVQGQNQYSELVMSRLAGNARPVPLPSPPTWADSQARIATDPSGGWVISYATRPPNALGQAPERLATVSTTGHVRPFGPTLNPVAVTALAVRPDGSAVAVALSYPTTRTAPAQIALVPLPGHAGTDRTWTLSAPGWVRTMAESLSWAPGGTLLTYIPGGDETGGGFAGAGAVTLNTAAPGTVAPSTSSWPQFRKQKGQCALRAGAWQLRTGSYLALEQCTGGDVVVVAANYLSGANEARAVKLPGGTGGPYYGCGQPVLAPEPAASEVLISGCGLYLYNPHQQRLAAVRGPLTGATFWSGGS
jgi:hypothetical protein